MAGDMNRAAFKCAACGAPVEDETTRFVKCPHCDRPCRQPGCMSCYTVAAHEGAGPK